MAIELEYTNSLTLASLSMMDGLFTLVHFDVMLLRILVWLDVNAIELITPQLRQIMLVVWQWHDSPLNVPLPVSP